MSGCNTLAKRHKKTSKSSIKKYKSYRTSGKSGLRSYATSATSIKAMYNPMSHATHNVVAPRFFTNLEYGFSGNLAGAAGYQFTVLGNGLSLPGNTADVFTGAGGTLFPATVALNALQPLGFSAIADLYNSYRVWTSSITVSAFPEFNPAGVPTSGAAQLVIFPTNTEASLADVQKAQSLPYSKTKILTTYASAQDCTITNTMDTKSVFGLSETQMKADSKYYSLTGTNPSNSFWYNALISNTTNAVFSCRVIVKVNYRVEFFDPNESGISAT